METYKTFRGLIYLIIISGIVVFLVVSFQSKSNHGFMPDTTYIRLLEERADLKAKAEILQFQATQLSIQLSEIKEKEKPIKSYFAKKKTDYTARPADETDREFLELFK